MLYSSMKTSYELMQTSCGVGMIKLILGQFSLHFNYGFCGKRVIYGRLVLALYNASSMWRVWSVDQFRFNIFDLPFLQIHVTLELMSHVAKHQFVKSLL